MNKYIIETGVCPNESCGGVVLSDWSPSVEYSACADCGTVLKFEDKTDSLRYHPRVVRSQRASFVWESGGVARMTEALETRYLVEYEDLHLDPRLFKESLCQVAGNRDNVLCLFFESARGHARRAPPLPCNALLSRTAVPALDIECKEPLAFSTAPFYDTGHVVVTDSVLKALILNYAWYSLERCRLPVVVSSARLPLWASVDADKAAVFCAPSSEPVIRPWLLESGVSACIFNTGDVFGMADAHTLTQVVRRTLKLLEERRDETRDDLRAGQRVRGHGEKRIVRLDTGAGASAQILPSDARLL